MGIQNPANSRITTNTDTEVIAAPGAGKRIVLLSLTIDVETAGSSSKARIEDGAGGDIIGTLDTSDDNNRLDRVWHADGRSGLSAEGRPMSENTALNVETTGSGAATIVVNVVYLILG